MQNKTVLLGSFPILKKNIGHAYSKNTLRDMAIHQLENCQLVKMMYSTPYEENHFLSGVTFCFADRSAPPSDTYTSLPNILTDLPPYQVQHIDNIKFGIHEEG